MFAPSNVRKDKTFQKNDDSLRECMKKKEKEPGFAGLPHHVAKFKSPGTAYAADLLDDD